MTDKHSGVPQYRKVGLVGGMGPLSTMPYYQGIVYGVRAKTRDDFFPDLTIESVNVFEILDMCGREDYDAVTMRLCRAIENLAKTGCEFAVLTANTSHIVFDRLKECSPIPLLSIVESTSREALRRSYGKIALLGTEFTMKGDFYKKPFVEKGIEIVVPNEPEMALVDTRIREELELGIIKESTLCEFRAILERMKAESGIQAVVLGCTELPLLLDVGNSPVPCLNTVEIHVADIVECILGIDGHGDING